LVSSEIDPKGLEGDSVTEVCLLDAIPNAIIDGLNAKLDKDGEILASKCVNGDNYACFNLAGLSGYKALLNFNPWSLKKYLKKKLKNNFKKDKKRFYTKKEGEEYSKDYINKNGDLPCTYCGKTIRPKQSFKRSLLST